MKKMNNKCRYSVQYRVECNGRIPESAIDLERRITAYPSKRYHKNIVLAPAPNIIVLLVCHIEMPVGRALQR